MRKALFRKDLWKDVGPKKENGVENGDVAAPTERPPVPKLHVHHYKYTRRMRAVGIMQIITGCFLYFVSIFLSVFGARGYMTEYLIPMGCVTGPSTVLTGIFARETCRDRRKWMIISYVIFCSLTILAAFVQFIGACAAFGKEDIGWKEDLITEPVIASFRYLSYMILIVLCFTVMSMAMLSIVLDLRMMSAWCRQRCCNYSWMLEKNVVEDYDNPETLV